MKIYLAGQQTLANRGCEALVVSSMQMLSQACPGVTFVIPSTDVNRDREAIERYEFSNYIFVDAPRITFMIRLWNRLMKYIPQLADVWVPSTMAWDQNTLAELRTCDRVLHIGGDTFSYDYSYAGLVSNTAQIDTLDKLGIHQEVWCATVGPFHDCKPLERRVIRKLKKVDRITVRETSSRDYLKTKHIIANVVGDPAFTLLPNTNYAQGKKSAKRRIVLNVSPYVYKGNTEDIVNNALLKFAEKRLSEGFEIALLSHVNTPTSSDSRVLKGVFGRMLLQDNIFLIPTNLSAAEYKGVVAASDYVIASRTHVTIAGFSSGIPVVSIGYSAKAPRLNKFLFGHESYTLQSSAITEASLEATFQRVVSSKREISATLQSKTDDLRMAFKGLCRSVTTE